MANIVSVHLENFQSHKDTFIQFEQGLNVIVGQSDSGKTAILRGIRWVLYNQPRGTDFIRVGADYVRVTVAFSHGTKIIRERTSSKNRYIIQKDGEDELVLEGFGVHVPEEVMVAHGMKHFRIDRDNELMIHLSQQLDGPFLLEQSNSVRAKTLGRISGAHFLDMAIRDVSKDVTSLNQQIKFKQTDIDQLNNDLMKYNTLDQMAKQLQHTDKQLETIERKQRRVNTLQACKHKKNELELEINKEREVEKLVLHVHDWEKRINILQNKKDRLMKYKEKRTDYANNERASDQCHSWLHKTKGIDKAQSTYEQIVAKRTKIVQLIRAKNKQTMIAREEQKEKSKLKMAQFLEKIPADFVAHISLSEEKYRKLVATRKRLQTYRSNAHQLEKKLQTYIPVTEMPTKYEHITAMQNRLVTLHDIRHKLNTIKERVTNGKKYIETQKIAQKEAEQNLEKRLQEEGVCPTCGQTICVHGGRM